jgi:hypothetical protein
MVFEGKTNTMETGHGMDVGCVTIEDQTKISEFQKENRTQTEKELTGSSPPLWLWVGRFAKKRNYRSIRGNE